MADPLATALAGMPIAFQKRRRDKWAPRQSFAETLLKQGSSTAPVYSWGEGLARAGQGLLGGVFGNWYERQEDRENQTKAKTLAEALASGDMDKITAAAASNPDLQDVAVRMAFAKALDKYQRDAVRQQAGAAGVIPGQGAAPPSGPTGPGGDSTIDPNNIGNIRDMQRGGFRAFASPEEGVAAAIKLVQQYPQAFNGGKPMTLLQVGERWAPKGDGNNDPAQWARNIAQASGLPVDQPLDFSDPRVQMAFARGLHVAEKGTQFAPDVYLRGVQMASGAPASSPAPGQAGGAPPPSGASGLPPSIAGAGSVTGGWSFSPISSAQAAPMPGQPMPPQAPPQVPGVPNPPPAGTPPTTPVPPGPPQASPNLSPTMPFADFYGQGDAARAALDALNKGGGTVPGAMMTPPPPAAPPTPVAPVQAPGGQLRLGPNGEIMAGDQPIAGPVQAPPPGPMPAPSQAPPQAPPAASSAIPPQVQQYSQRLRAEAQRAQQTAAALAQRGDPGWQAAADQARKLALEADKFDAEYGIKAGELDLKQQDQARKGREEQRDAAQASLAAGTSIAGFNQARRMVADVLNAPGLSTVVGGLYEKYSTNLGPQGRNAQAVIDALKSKISLVTIQAMRDASKTGGAAGSMTEKEWPRFEQMFGNLEQAQSLDQFKRVLMQIDQELAGYIQRVQGANPTLPSQPAPAAPGPGPGPGGVPPPPPGFTVQGR